MSNVDERNRKRYPIPAERNPADDWIVTLGVPGGTDWLITISDHIHDLTWSNLHDRDESKTHAAQVARRWASAFAAHPITIATGEGIMIRQNPDNPCELQQSIDSGETWEPVFDAALCAQAIPVYTEETPDGRSPETASIDDALGYLRDILVIIAAEIDDETPRDDIIALAIQHVYGDISVVITPAAPDLVDAMIAATPEQRADAIDPAAWVDVRNELVCRQRDDQDTLQPYGNWLQHLSDNVAGLLQLASDELVQTLNDVAEIIMSGTASSARAISTGFIGSLGGESGFGDDPGCEEEIEEWFTVIVQEGVGYGTYGGNNYKVAQEFYALHNGLISAFTFRSLPDYGTPDSSVTIWLGKGATPDSETLWSHTFTIVPNTEQKIVIDEPVPVLSTDRLWLAFKCSTVQDEGDIHRQSVCLNGEYAKGAVYVKVGSGSWGIYYTGNVDFTASYTLLIQ